MQLCGPGCFAICDFCAFLERKEDDDAESYCPIKKRMVYWTEMCDDFRCFRIEEEE